jgi:small multidrug resistance family-3 protein
MRYIPSLQNSSVAFFFQIGITFELLVVKTMQLINSLFYFAIAGLCEIGGGYLIWLYLREGKSPWLAVFGSILLTIYGFVATKQPDNFGRTYAAYGGIFIILSLIWGWKIDGFVADKLDLMGAGIIFVGVLIMMYAPR